MNSRRLTQKNADTEKSQKESAQIRENQRQKKQPQINADERRYENNNEKSAQICGNLRQKNFNSRRLAQMYADEFKHKDITEKIIKGFYEVYNELGHGFLESVYEEALYIVLKEYGLQVDKQKEVTVYFRGHEVGVFRADLVVNDCVIVEIKAVSILHPKHEAQTINYLKATRIEVGLLLNFGEKAEFRRYAYDNKRK
jgi:GxxExxY protein